MANTNKRNTPHSATGDSDRQYDLFSQAPAAIAVTKGKEHVIDFANDFFLEITAKDSSIIGQPVRDVFTELKEQGFFELLDNVYTTGTPFIGNEMPIEWQVNAEGKKTTSYLNFVYRPLRDKDSRTYGILAHAVEVTEQVNARRLVEENEERYRTLFNSIDQGFCIIEMIFDDNNKPYDYRFIEVNSVFEQQTGLKNAVGKTMRQFAPDMEEDWFSIYGNVALTGKPVRFENRAEALGRWYDAFATRIGGDDSRRVAVLFTDITEKKKIKDAIQASEERFRTLIEQSTDAIQLVDTAGNILYTSESIRQVLGYTPEELEGVGVEDFIHPDDYPHFLEKFQTITLAPQNQVRLEYRVKHKDGSWAWVETVGVNHLDTPNINAIVGNFRNITERKNAEAEQLKLMTITEQRDALMKLNKSKDEFIALASHQLRTPATAVKQYISLILDEFAGPITADQMQYLQTAYDSNERQLSIINSLLKTAQIDASKYKLDKQPCDLVSLMNEAIDNFKPALDIRKQTVAFTAAKKKITALVDIAEIELVIINLLENASKYSHTGTQIQIAINAEGRFVEIIVSDKGVGIAKEHHGRIFDKFTRVDNELSDTVSGTGLGLYWVKQIIEMHGGTIQLKSALGKGTTFIIRMPHE